MIAIPATGRDVFWKRCPFASREAAE